MKKTILITIGVLIIVIILAVWTYLFMYGAPQNVNEVFTRFGMGNTVTEPRVNPDSTVDVKPETTEGAPQKLRQLTLKPVAGAVFISEGIRYVEGGTGHVYDINLTTGEETLIEGTTIPQTIEALFSSDGAHVAITSLGTNGKETVLEAISTTSGAVSRDPVALPDGATNIAFGKVPGTLTYLLRDTTGSSGYSYNIAKDVSTRLFTIPLRDVRVLWGTPQYVYTIPTAYQAGHLYSLSKNDLVYVEEGRDALMALTYASGTITTGGAGDSISSKIHDVKGKITSAPVPLIPEKCVLNQKTTHTFFCAVPANLAEGLFPDDWYKGTLAYNDILWEIDLTNVTATVLSNPLTESGREIDVVQIGTNTTGTYIYMINKNDNTLWMFDTTL